MPRVVRWRHNQDIDHDPTITLPNPRGITSIANAIAVNSAGDVAFPAQTESGGGLFVIDVSTCQLDAGGRVVRNTCAMREVTPLPVDFVSQGFNDLGQLTVKADHLDKSIVVLAPKDDDGDGAPNFDEVLTMDENDDGVASLPNAEDGRQIVIRAPPGAALSNVTTLQDPGTLPNVFFPVGLISFTLDGIAPGAEVDVEIDLPPNVVPTDWYKQQGLGPPTPLPSTAWSFNPPTVTLTLRDGGVGDADLLANGVILDPGGPVPEPSAVASGGIALLALACLRAPRRSRTTAERRLR